MQTTKKYIDPNQLSGKANSPVNRSNYLGAGWLEKAGSIAGGLLVGYLGLQKLNIGNLMVSFGSAFFLYKSMTNQPNLHINHSLGTAGNDEGEVPAGIRQSIRVEKPREEVYRSWRALKKSDGVLRHLDEVIYIDGQRRYHWEMKLPKGLGQVEWVAVISEEIENHSISFHTHKNSDISHSGRIEFRDIPGGQGTEMEVLLDYYPPVGDIGRGAAKALHSYITGLILEDMNRFKYWLEEGRLPEKK